MSGSLSVMILVPSLSLPSSRPILINLINFPIFMPLMSVTVPGTGTVPYPFTFPAPQTKPIGPNTYSNLCPPLRFPEPVRNFPVIYSLKQPDPLRLEFELWKISIRLRVLYFLVAQPVNNSIYSHLAGWSRFLPSSFMAGYFVALTFWSMPNAASPMPCLLFSFSRTSFIFMHLVMLMLFT